MHLHVVNLTKLQTYTNGLQANLYLCVKSMLSKHRAPGSTQHPLHTTSATLAAHLHHFLTMCSNNTDREESKDHDEA